MQLLVILGIQAVLLTMMATTAGRVLRNAAKEQSRPTGRNLNRRVPERRARHRLYLKRAFFDGLSHCQN